MQTELGADVKIFDDEHVEPMLRCISDMALQVIHWRQMRPYLLAEEIDILPCDASAPTRDLIVRGYLHGSALSTYDFVHLTGEAPPDSRHSRGSRPVAAEARTRRYGAAGGGGPRAPAAGGEECCGGPEHSGGAALGAAGGGARWSDE